MSTEILIERENWMINSIVSGLGDKMAPRETPLVNYCEVDLKKKSFFPRFVSNPLPLGWQ
jgi:hypothetical protein